MSKIARASAVPTGEARKIWRKSPAVRPVCGPGQDMSPAILWDRWGSTLPSDVVEFYGHGWSNGAQACFSNFFDQSDAPFNFELPAELCAVSLSLAERTVACECSEKAIMLCKAAAMGDRSTFNKIRESCEPSQIKKLGRQVRGFDQDVWDTVVCSVAFEVVFQKFLKTPKLQPILLATGDSILAEATRNDVNWGIGLDRGDPLCRTPILWKGCNMLGWALMEARFALRCLRCESVSRRLRLQD